MKPLFQLPQASSGLLRLLKLHGLQQTLETEVVGVAVNGGLVGRRAHHFWLQRCKRVGSISLHVHLQLQEDLQGVGHLCLAAGGGQLAAATQTGSRWKTYMNTQ